MFDRNRSPGHTLEENALKPDFNGYLVRLPLCFSAPKDLKTWRIVGRHTIVNIHITYIHRSQLLKSDFKKYYPTL